MYITLVTKLLCELSLQGRQKTPRHSFSCGVLQDRREGAASGTVLEGEELLHVH